MRTAILILGFLPAAAAAGLVDRVAATVGNQAITLGEVLEELRVTAFLNGDPLDLGPAARREAAERLVDQELIRREMTTGQYPQPTDADVAQTFAGMKKARFHADTEYRDALRHYGVTEQQLKEHLRWQIASLRFTEMRFRNDGEQPSQATLRQMQQAAQKRGTGDAARIVQTPAPPPPKPQPGTTPQRANRLAAPANADASPDEQFEAWLKQLRADTRVQFKKEAFE